MTRNQDLFERKKKKNISFWQKVGVDRLSSASLIFLILSFHSLPPLPPFFYNIISFALFEPKKFFYCFKVWVDTFSFDFPFRLTSVRASFVVSFDPQTSARNDLFFSFFFFCFLLLFFLLFYFQVLRTLIEHEVKKNHIKMNIWLFSTLDIHLCLERDGDENCLFSNIPVTILNCHSFRK